MANIYDPEKTKGVIEISLAEDETPASVRDRFSFLVRSLFKQKGQRVKSLQLELLEEDSVEEDEESSGNISVEAYTKPPLSS